MPHAAPPTRRAGRGLMDAIETHPAATIALASEALFPATELALPSALRGDNWDAVRPEMGRHLRHDVYQARVARLSPIALHRLPGPTIVQGGSFAAMADGAWVREQVHPDWAQGAAGLLDPPGGQGEIVQVAPETVLVARYGVATWGHWLGELLPRMVLTELRFPGRFRYALPLPLFVQPNGTVWDSLRQSVAAYGIPFDRCIPLAAGTRYSFAAAWCMSSVWSDRIMHPAAVTAMRDQLRAPVPHCELTGGKVAFLRTDTNTRQLSNLAEVEGVLAGAGYPTVAVGRLAFVEQVALFRAARHIVSVLGSALSGLIYAPEGICVASLAPRDFGDWFFYALIQGRGGIYVDIRGEPEPGHDSLLHWAPFSVAPIALRQGLAQLRGA